MDQTQENLWRFVESFGLHDQGQIEKTREEFEQSLAAGTKSSPRGLADWLCRRNFLTAHQARAILGGQGEWLRLGEYLIQEPRGTRQRWGRRWDAVHIQAKHPVVLHIPSLPQILPSLGNPANSDDSPLTNILGVVDARGTTLGVTERPMGRDLQHIIRSRRPIPIDQVCEIGLQLVEALREVHAAGCVHGNLSPDEVVLCRPGLIKLLWSPWRTCPFAEGSTNADTDLSTVHYEAPELAFPGQQADLLSDVYALGCTMFELLSGRKPFPYESVEKLRQAHAAERIPSLVELLGTPPALQELIAFLMAKQRDVRWRDWGQIEGRLRSFVPPGWQRPTGTPPATLANYRALAIHRGSDDRRSPPGPTATQLGPSMTSIVSASKMVAGAGAYEPGPLAIKTEPTKNSGRSEPRNVSRSWGIGGAVVLAVCGLSGLLYWALQPALDRPLARLDFVPASGVAPRNPNHTQSPPQDKAAEISTAQPPAPSDTADNGRWLWESPTHGNSIPWRFIPAGTQLLVQLRPAELFSDSNAAHTLQALGPEFLAWQEGLERETGVPWRNVAQLRAAFVPQDVGKPRVALEIVLSEEAELPTATSSSSNDGANAQPRGRWFVRLPSAANEPIVLTSDAELLQEYDAMTPHSTNNLRRQLAQLVSDSDADRHATMIFAPNFLVADGRELFPPLIRQIIAHSVDLLDQDAQACLLSVHVSDVTYVEWRQELNANARLASALTAASSRLDDQARRAIGGLANREIDPFWQPLALRIPSMIEACVSQVRWEIDGQQLVGNFVLPPQAAHNLVLAAELAWNSPVIVPGSASSQQASVPRTLEELLAFPLDLHVPQQSLDALVVEITQQVRDLVGIADFQIELRGADLQLDGITKNQQIRNLHLVKKPLREVLTELVRKANPQAVERPSMPGQALVWVVRQQDEEAGKWTIVLTTRTVAGQKGYELPAEFVESGGESALK